MADQVMEFEEREEPKFIRFATGDVCEGILLLIENVKVQGSPAVRYTIRQPSGEEVAFLGTNQINRKLRRGDEGHGVQIACVGEDPKIKKKAKTA